jgi:prevent-host-death family protein
MRNREPMTQTVNTEAASEAFNDLVKKVSRHETRVLVEEHGKPVAAIVSPEDLQRLTQLDAEWEEDWRVFDDIHSRNQDKNPEEVERDVAAALTAVRAKARRTHGHQSPT